MLWAVVVLGLIILLGMAVRPCASQTEIARSLFVQMARWSTAATQDANPVIAVLHANYGVGYMMALQSIAGDDELERMIGVSDLRRLFREVENVQHEATRHLARTCPAAAPPSMLARYGAEAFSSKTL
jgi:hypothetical protein